jgi:fibronectin-binding autotransporter adhesin
MNNKTAFKIFVCSRLAVTARTLLYAFIAIFSLSAAFKAQAASQTWTNAPVDANWSNTNNWVGKAAPGLINQTNTASTTSADIATFNSPIFGTIGGASNPILTDDATIQNSRGRFISGMIFDTVDCGAYVISNTSPAAFATASTPETGMLNVTHNGSITINAAVTNSQKIMVPLYIRLPSSTAGIYNFVNNATDPSVTLFLNAVTNGSANTRGTVFTFGGSNTGTNTANALSKGGTTTGAMGLTKQGAGTWILPNGNDLAAQSVNTINNGTLVVQNQAAFGASTTVSVISNGVLRVDGVTLTNTTGGITVINIVLNNGGTLRMNGSGTNNTKISTAPATSATLATTSASDVLTVNTNSGGLADTVLHVAGPGTVVLAQPSSYIGKWALDAGTTQVITNSALGTGSLANISAGAILDFSPLGAVSYSPGPAGIGGTGTGTAVGSTAATIKADVGGVVDLATGAKAISLTFTPTAFSGDTTHPALYVSQGTLSLSANPFTVNNASGTPLGAGTYRLIQQASGNITTGGGYVVNVTGSGTAAGTLGSIQVNGGNVDLVVFAYTANNLVWKGGNPNANWDNSATANWLNGITPSVFNPSDIVALNATGAASPTVNLLGTLLPGSVTVDTSAANYTFSGSGLLAGTASLTKINTGTLILQTVNTYSGGTVVSNGTLRVGVNNALPASGANGVAINSPAVLDLNTFSNAISGLNGDGLVDNLTAGTPVLTVGNNNGNGTFLGIIQNTAGTLALTKVGSGVQTILGANTYTGPTTVSDGTLRVGNLNALGASPLILTNSGNLDVRSSLLISNLYGTSGTLIANNSSATTNILIFQANSTNVASTISDGSGGGGIGILLNSGYLQLMGPNTYSGGTILASGTTLGIGVINGVASGNAGTGSIVASNGTTVTLTSAVSTSSQLGSPIVTVDNATVTFTSSGTADSFNGPFTGSATATNIFGGNMSIGGSQSFSNFLGTVIFTNLSPNAVRFNATIEGGDNTLFDFHGGNIQTRDATTVRFGALTGNGGIYSPSVTPGASYWIGAKGLDTTYSGIISGSNSIVKVGAGRLTLNGGVGPVIILDQNYNLVTNNIYISLLTYLNTTTISNGVLALSAPANLISNTIITLAGTTAVLDASSMGYGVNQYDENSILTNKYLVTNGVFEIMPNQTLAGIGTIRAGSVVLDAGSIFNVGLPLGSLTITNNIELAGAVNVSVNASNSPNSSLLLAQSIIVDGTASLVVTNRGSENAATFQLFNHPVNFPSVTLPTLTGTNLWINNLAVDGSLTLVAPVFVPTVNTNPTNITTSVSGGNLTLTWPSDHTGWRLQTQTNSITAGLGTNWLDVAGATATNQVVVPINSTNGSVFFRMVYP